MTTIVTDRTAEIEAYGNPSLLAYLRGVYGPGWTYLGSGRRGAAYAFGPVTPGEPGRAGYQVGRFLPGCSAATFELCGDDKPTLADAERVFQPRPAAGALVIVASGGRAVRAAVIDTPAVNGAEHRGRVFSSAKGTWGPPVAIPTGTVLRVCRDLAEAQAQIMGRYALTQPPGWASADARPTDDQIDDRVGAWHEGRFAEGIPLHRALGWSQEEYDLWIVDPNAVPDRALPTPEEISAEARTWASR